MRRDPVHDGWLDDYDSWRLDYTDDDGRPDPDHDPNGGDGDDD